MAWIRTIDVDEAKGNLEALLRGLIDPETGRVDHILNIHSLHPAGLKGHLGLYRAVMRGTPTLPKAEREMIALTVSKLNECHY